MKKNSASDLFIKRLEKSSDIAEVQVSYKRNLEQILRITTSQEAFNTLFPLFNKDIICFKEEFFLLLLNRANYVLGWYKVSSGGTAGTVVDPKIIFILALRTNANSILMVHNHPSGNLNPSEADLSLTKKVLDGGKLFDITLLDHLIVTPEEKYYSFADEGVV